MSAPGRSRDALAALLLISAATALAYSNTLGASFHLDDFPRIVQNDGLHDLGKLWPPHGNRYLGDLSFALNFRLGGLEPLGYHLVNLLVHLCNALLVAWLAAATLRTPALRDAAAGPLLRERLPLTAGLLFALHPIQTQAVTYVVQRFASLATLFCLLSLVLYAQARLSLERERSPRLRAASLLVLSAAFAAAAMRTKEISFTLPVVTLGYELLFFRGPWRRLLLLLPVAATALLVPLGLAASGQRLADALGDGQLPAETLAIPRSVYLLTESRVLATYLRLLVLPVGQNLDHDFPLSHTPWEPGVLISLAVLVTVVSGAIALLVRARRSGEAAGVLVFSGVAWFFVTSSVESSVIPIRDVIVEHRMYLPSAGAAVVLATALLCALERLRSRLPAGVGLAAALLVTAVPLGAATYARNRVWKDELTLWSDVVAKSPQKARPHNNLGVALAEAGRFAEAIPEYREAIRLDPGFGDPHNNLGIALYSTGRGLDEAIREYREAIRLDFHLANAHSNLGLAYRLKGQLDDAIRALRQAIRLEPGLAEAHLNLGVAYQVGGQPELAAQEYREALRLDPDLAEARQHLRDVTASAGSPRPRAPRAP
jgi:tetratricopeptide (TPR) repeat protein